MLLAVYPERYRTVYDPRTAARHAYRTGREGTTSDMAARIRCLSAQKNVAHGFFA